jgi:hypothetical protein
MIGFWFIEASSVACSKQKHAYKDSTKYSILEPLLLELDGRKVCQVLQVALGFALWRYLAKFVLCF